MSNGRGILTIYSLEVDLCKMEIGRTDRRALIMISDHTCADRPLPTCKTSIVVAAAIFTLFKANTQRWWPLAATSFVVSFVLAFNKVNIVALTTMLVLHVGNGRSDHV